MCKKFVFVFKIRDCSHVSVERIFLQVRPALGEVHAKKGVWMVLLYGARSNRDGVGNILDRLEGREQKG